MGHEKMKRVFRSVYTHFLLNLLDILSHKILVLRVAYLTYVQTNSKNYILIFGIVGNMNAALLRS